jgi:hypothetical protein
LTLCLPDIEGIAASTALQRPALGLDRLEWDGGCEVEFHPSHGEWIALLRRSGFEIEELVEAYPSADATSRYPYVTLQWARSWPSEEVWKARKGG